MSVLKHMYFSYTTKCFPQFSVHLLSNPRFAFHTCVPLNERKKKLRNIKRNNTDEPYCAPILPEQFGKVVALDPENVKGYYDEKDLPKVKKRLDKDRRIGNTKISEQEQKNESDIHDAEVKSELKFRYKQVEKLGSLGQIMTNLTNRKYRERHKEVLLEGKSLIKDALSSGLQAKFIFFSRASDVEDLELPENVRVYKTAYKELQLWSCNTTCPGVTGVFKLPEDKIINENNMLPVTVICDNIREPGNLGAILRVAAGVGCQKLILTKGCVDVWNPKVLRGGCGAHFKVSFMSDVTWSDIESKISETEEIIVADNRLPISYQNENMDWDNKGSCKINNSAFDNLPTKEYTSVDYKNCDSIVFIVGGETQGISNDAYQFAFKRGGKKIFIPLNNDLESLNSAVALGIVLYETRRQMLDLSSILENKQSNCEEVVKRAS